MVIVSKYETPEEIISKLKRLVHFQIKTNNKY